MNKQYGILQALRVAMHPDKTFIGKVAKGFDFLGFHVSPTGTTVSDAALSRHEQKVSRLYEQSASKKRIRGYRLRWLVWAFFGAAAGHGVCATYSGSYGGDSPIPDTVASLGVAADQAGVMTSHAPTDFVGDAEVNGLYSPLFVVFPSSSAPGPLSVYSMPFTVFGASIPPTLHCMNQTPSSITISTGSFSSTIVLSPGTACSLTVSLAPGHPYSDIELMGTLSREGDLYYLRDVTISGGVYDIPSAYPTSFTATANSTDTITTTWTDATGTVTPDKYLVMCSTTDSFSDPVNGPAPVDDTSCADGSGVQNIAQSTQSAAWTGLDAETQYFFKIFPYTNTGSDVDYKTDGTAPTANATTTDDDTVLSTPQNIPVFGPLGLLAMLAGLFWFGTRRRKA